MAVSLAVSEIFSNK